MRPAYRLQDLQPEMLVPPQPARPVPYRVLSEMRNVGFVPSRPPLQLPHTSDTAFSTRESEKTIPFVSSPSNQPRVVLTPLSRPRTQSDTPHSTATLQDLDVSDAQSSGFSRASLPATMHSTPPRSPTPRTLYGRATRKPDRYCA